MPIKAKKSKLVVRMVQTPLVVEGAKSVKFRYLKPESEKSAIYTLTSEGGTQPAPLESWESNGVTYYKGWCVERNAPRVLRSDRVIHYTVKY